MNEADSLFRRNKRPKALPKQGFHRRPRTVAVMDTNVVLDIFSCHDLMTELDTLVPTQGADALDDEKVTFRIERAREGMLLGLHLHEIGASTFSLHSEVVAQLARVASPSEHGTSFKTAFTTGFIHFVKERVLDHWQPTMPKRPDGASRNDADRAVVGAAAERGVPLISAEGYSHDGTFDHTKLVRREAVARNVTVMLPREFYAGKLDDPAAIDRFLSRFAAQAPAYLRAHAWRFGDDGMPAFLSTVHGIYRLVLRGEAADRQNVRLSLAQRRTGPT